jgi:hypothetical protein
MIIKCTLPLYGYMIFQPEESIDLRLCLDRKLKLAFAFIEVD